MGSQPRRSDTFRFVGNDEIEDADVCGGGDDKNGVDDEEVGLTWLLKLSSRLSIRQRNMTCPRNVKLNDNLLLFLEFDLRPAGSN